MTGNENVEKANAALPLSLLLQRGMSSSSSMLQARALSSAAASTTAPRRAVVITRRRSPPTSSALSPLAAAAASSSSSMSRSSAAALPSSCGQRGSFSLPASTLAPSRSAGRRRGNSHVVAVIPQLGADGRKAAPDLPSFLLKERIVYLGMALVPSVTELLVAEMLYLQYDDATKPIYLYINSAGVIGGKQGSRLGYETEALSIYDTMEHVKPPVRTLCVGVAYGESALLLAAGQRGSRAALPSASIMLRQPMQRYTQMQASDVDIYRKEMRRTKDELFRLLAKHTGNDIERIETDLNRPRYMNPFEAVNYGVIDRVLAPDEAQARALVTGTSWAEKQAQDAKEREAKERREKEDAEREEREARAKKE